MFIEGGGAKKKFLQEGDVLFREGDPGDAAFIVDSGLIGIYKVVEGEEIELGTLKAGELFGEMAIVDGSKRMAYAVAKCSIPDDHISPRRSALFMARSVLRDFRDGGRQC